MSIESSRFEEARTAIFETTGEQLVDLWRRYQVKAAKEVFAAEAADKFRRFDGIFTAAIQDVSEAAAPLFEDLFTLGLRNEASIEGSAEQWAENQGLSFLEPHFGEPPRDTTDFDAWFSNGGRSSRQFQEWMYRTIQMKSDSWLAPTWFDARQHQPGEESWLTEERTAELLADRYSDLWLAISSGLEWARQRARVQAASSTPDSTAVVGAEAPVREAEPEVPFHHSPDFRWVSLRGREFTLSVNQSRVVRRLWEAHSANITELHQDSVLEASDILSNRMRDVFKNSPAWTTLVIPGTGKGFFRLNL